MWTLKASYIELLSVLNLVDLTETELLSQKKKTPDSTGKQQSLMSHKFD